MNLSSLQGPYKHVFMTNDEVDEALKIMENDRNLNTKLSYVNDNSASIKLVTFREKHLTYLKEHPKVNPKDYLSNLRAMIKKRP